MPERTLPPRENPSLALEVAQDIASVASTRFLWTAWGFACVMLVGVCVILPSSHASPSPLPELAFNPALPGGARARPTAFAGASQPTARFASSLSPEMMADGGAPPPPPKSGRLGGTVDQDGKSNVWAVEPTMQVDKGDKGLSAFFPVIAVGVLAIVSVPLLTTIFVPNADQV